MKLGPDFDPSSIWYASTIMWRQGQHRRARFLKLLNYLVFRTILPPEADLTEKVKLGHFGLGVVVHPNVVIGRNVMLWHGVTLSVSDSPGSSTILGIGNNVEIGANAVIVTRLKTTLRITSGVRVGANSVVTRDITEAGSYGGIPAKLLRGR